MKREEASILAPACDRTLDRIRRTALSMLAAWVLLWPGGPFVSEVRAQVDSAPAVVPPAAAYIGEADGGPESVLPRWRTVVDEHRTLWVYIPKPPATRPDFWSETVRAMEAWNAVRGIPLSFRSTAHQRSADVEFRWIQRFDARQAGTTDWETDGDGWLSHVTVTLAVEHEDGTPMGNEFLRLVALHELGHVIGLPHSDDPADVMHPGNRSLEISDRDIRSARRLYERLDSEEVSGP